MTNKERIIELSKSLTPNEVAEICNVSAGYVYRILRKHHPKTLTLENYLKAIKMEIINKDDLANYFGVSRMTINRFERSNLTKEAIGNALYIVLGDIDSVKQKLSLTNQESATLAQLPTLSGVTKELRQMLNALEAYKDKTTLNEQLYQNILAALNSLNC